MVLYHTISTYQLLSAIVHKVKYNNQKKCVLALSTGNVQRFPQYIKLKEFFDDIVLINNSFQLVKGVYPKSNTGFCKEQLKKAGYSAGDFQEIHVGGCHFAFGAYLVHEQIPFIFWEDARGILFNKNVLKEIDAKSNREKAEWCDSMGLYDGNNPCIVKRIGNLNAANGREIPEKTEHFDVVGEYLGLPDDVRKAIRSFFTEIERIEIPEESVLLLTQHFANLEIMSLEEQILMYQLFVDYFFEGRRIVIKPHPDDILYYGLLFPESKVIREKFPSEFLPEIFTHKPKTIATVSSTSIDNLSDYFDGGFSLGNRFEKDFRYIHRYQIVICLIEYLGAAGRERLIGTMDALIKNLPRKKESPPIDKTEVYIMDDIKEQDEFDQRTLIPMLENLSENSMVIFVNSRKDFCFYDLNHKSLWEQIVPICIRKKPFRTEEFYSDTDEEIIYFYSKNERMIELAEKFHYNQILKNTGLEVSVESLTPEQKRIKVLEGILEATEQRLLYYIEKYETKNE